MLAFDSWHDLFDVRFKLGKDVPVVLTTVALVTGSLWVATNVVGAENGGWYFLVYAGLTAACCGIALPLVWTVGVSKRPVSALGLTTKFLAASLGIQLVLSVGQYALTFSAGRLPLTAKFPPLIALVLCIGFFEAVFWRGWVFSRLEEAFGFIPALILGSALYAVYHIGYGMTWGEMGVLFWVGVFYAVVFRLTRNVFILWPLLQPLGQLFTLAKSGLDLPLIAVLGFGEALVVMGALAWLAHRYWKKRALAWSEDGFVAEPTTS